MGFYATDQLDAVMESHQENPYPPSKNRVWNFFTTSDSCAGFSESQPVEPHQEKWPTPTATASGVRFYGYRYYQPEIGRWCSRDPITEKGFLRMVRLVKARKQASDMNDYVICANRSVMLIDPLGLQYCVTWTDPIFGGTHTVCYDPPPPPPPPPPPNPWSCCSKSECRQVAWNDFKDCRDMVSGFCALICLFSGPGYPECIISCEGILVGSCFVAFSINVVRCEQCPNQ